MLDRAVSVDADGEIVLSFSGGKAQGALDGTTSWVTLEPVAGTVILDSVLLERAS